MKFKRLTSIFLALLLILTLCAGCKSADEKKETSKVGTVEKEDSPQQESGKNDAAEQGDEKDDPDDDVNAPKPETVDVDLLRYSNSAYESVADEKDTIIDSGTSWEPGKTEIAYLGVENKGTLDLKYSVSVKVTDNGLVGALEYAVIDGVKAGELSPAGWSELNADAAQSGDLVAGELVIVPDGAIKVGEDVEYFALAVHMKEEAGNEYWGKDVTVDVMVTATQAVD